MFRDAPKPLQVTSIIEPVGTGIIEISPTGSMNCEPTVAQIQQQFGRTSGPPIPVAGSTGPSP